MSVKAEVPGGAVDRGALGEAIEAALAGSEAARDALFEALVGVAEAHIRMEYGWLPWQEQQDMIGEIFYWMAQKWQKLFRSYDPAVGPPLPFFREVIRRHCMRYGRSLKAQKRKNLILTDEELPMPEPLPRRLSGERRLQFREICDHLAAWSHGLSDRDQTIFWARLVEERPSREVAHTLGISAAVVDQRVTRMRKRLRKFLEEQSVELSVELALGMLLALILSWPGGL